MKDFLALTGAAFLIVLSVAIALALSGAIIGFGLMLFVGILANAGVVGASVGFWPDAFWLGLLLSLFGTSVALAAKS